MALGFAVSAFAAYVASPLAFVCTRWPDTGACVAAAGMFPTVQLLAAYAAALAVVGLARRVSVPKAFWRSALRDQALLGLGWMSGFLLTQTAPLILTALPVFDRFPSVFRHDPMPLLLAGSAEQAVDFVTAAAAAVAASSLGARWRARRWRRRCCSCWASGRFSGTARRPRG